MTSSEQVLYLIALAATRGVDAALSEAIELGLVDPDHHIESDEWATALAEAEEEDDPGHLEARDGSAQSYFVSRSLP